MSRSRMRRPPGAVAVLLALLVGAGGSAGVLLAARDRSGDVEVVEGMAEVLQVQPNDAPAENFLLVGSDSREGVDPNAPNAPELGLAEDFVGRRSDTIMILRRERNGGASLLSIPRDLWVPIAGRGESNRVNSSYNDGPAVLASTITQALGIPIQHYVEIDFVGFQDLVDAIGGVEICSMLAAQDFISGLQLDPGCHNLDGQQALAFTRSRQYQEFADGEWRTDQTGDIGRMGRQQQFIRNAADKVLEQVQADPFSLDRMLDAATRSLRIDGSLDPVRAATALRDAAAIGLTTYVLPVVGAEVDGKSVVELTADAEPILDYFRGTGSAPPTTTPG
ncbi:MAG: LCP family protein [Ilumatobacteraceae bacterium]